MSADRNEPKPFLSWCTAWVRLESLPILFLMLIAAGMGRWWAIPQAVWVSGRDTSSKELWIHGCGSVFVVCLLLIGLKWRSLSRKNIAGIERVVAIKRTHLGTFIVSLGLAFLTLWQIYSWYADGWTPKVSPHVYGELDYRYFKSLDLRLQQIANKIREGRVASSENAPLRVPAASLAIEPMKVNSKQIVSEIREYIVDWSEEVYARASDADGRDAQLRMLAMMVDPDPHFLDRYLVLKGEEEGRLELAIREVSAKEELTKKEHESIAKEWSQETVPEKKSTFANQVVAIEDQLNGYVRERVRLQGRLDVLANERLDQSGLNREYRWLHLPTVSRGGWLRIACTWFVAIYLSIRLMAQGCISVASFLKMLRIEIAGGDETKELATEGVEPPHGFGWFLMAAAIFWLGLGW